MAARRNSLAAAALALALALSGCAAPAPRPAPAAEAAARDTAARLGARQAEVTSFAGRGSLEYTVNESKYRFDAVIAASRPRSLRLQTFDVMGRPILTLAADPDRLSVLDHRQGILYAGRPTAAAVSRFVPVGLSVPQIITLVKGGAPLSGFDRAEIRPGYMDGRAVRRLVLHRSDRPWTETIYLPPDNLQIRAVEIGPEDGRPVFRLGYRNYDQSVSPALPRTIALEHLEAGETLRISYTQIKVNPDLSTGLFRLEPPPGVVTRPIVEDD